MLTPTETKAREIRLLNRANLEKEAVRLGIARPSFYLTHGLQKAVIAASSL